MAMIYDLALDDNLATTTVVNTGTGAAWTAGGANTQDLHSTDCQEGTGSFYMQSSSYTLVSPAAWTSNKLEIKFYMKLMYATAAENQNIFYMNDGWSLSDGLSCFGFYRLAGDTQFRWMARGAATGTQGSAISTNATINTTTWYLYTITIDASTSPWSVTIKQGSTTLTWSGNLNPAWFARFAGLQLRMGTSSAPIRAYIDHITVEDLGSVTVTPSGIVHSSDWSYTTGGGSTALLDGADAFSQKWDVSGTGDYFTVSVTNSPPAGCPTANALKWDFLRYWDEAESEHPYVSVVPFEQVPFSLNDVNPVYYSWWFYSGDPRAWKGGGRKFLVIVGSHVLEMYRTVAGYSGEFDPTPEDVRVALMMYNTGHPNLGDDVNTLAETGGAYDALNHTGLAVHFGGTGQPASNWPSVTIGGTTYTHNTGTEIGQGILYPNIWYRFQVGVFNSNTDGWIRVWVASGNEDHLVMNICKEAWGVSTYDTESGNTITRVEIPGVRNGGQYTNHAEYLAKWRISTEFTPFSLLRTLFRA